MGKTKSMFSFLLKKFIQHFHWDKAADHVFLFLVNHNANEIAK